MRIQIGAVALCEAPLNASPHSALNTIERLPVYGRSGACIDQPYKWNTARRQGIPDRRVAATDVPAEESVWPEADTCELLAARCEFQVCWRHLIDVSATMAIQDLVGASEEMSKGLAIITVTNNSIATSSGACKSASLQLATRASNYELVRHRSSHVLRVQQMCLAGLRARVAPA